ncbi:MAG: SDR family oxidoreductase [Chloroflexota bacterium]|nr:SDR family oxidoreductase [Chloroflexota bacterium]
MTPSSSLWPGRFSPATPHGSTGCPRRTEVDIHWWEWSRVQGYRLGFVIAKTPRSGKERARYWQDTHIGLVDGADIDATQQVSHESKGGALRFDGDLVVVTGASRGIGAAISELFASLGAHVISVSRTTPDTPRPGIDDLVADLSDDGAPDAIGARVEQDWGIPTVLVNNAGINLRSSLTEPAAPVMQLEFMVNAIAAARLISVIGGLMGRVGRGSVVNVGSVKATLPGRSLGYGMSKAALENLTRSAAALLGSQGIRVNAVAPGDVVGDTAPPDHGRAFSNPLHRAVTASARLRRSCSISRSSALLG